LQIKILLKKDVEQEEDFCHNIIIAMKNNKIKIIKIIKRYLIKKETTHKINFPKYQFQFKDNHL